MLLVSLGCGIAVASEDQDPIEISPEMQAAIDRLMEVTQMNAMIDQIADAMSQQMLGAMTDLPPEASEAIAELTLETIRELTAEGGLMDQMIPIYAKYFTHEDILGMVEFYETPLGKKTIALMPQIAAESAQVSMRWMTTKFPEMQKNIKSRMKAKGLDG